MKIICLIFAAVIFSGCTGYNRSAGSYSSPEVYGGHRIWEKTEDSNIRRCRRNPLVIIHGFGGARLKNAADNSNVWGETGLWDAVRPLPAEYLPALALPLKGDVPQSSTVPDGILDRFKVRVAGMDFNVDGYRTLIDMLTDAGYSTVPSEDSPPTLWIYAYDWRRDIADNAAGLADFLKKATKNFDHPVKFDIVGHSMGGLIARYFLAYGSQRLPDEGIMPVPDWRGAEMVQHVILAGTPNAGYTDICAELVNGLKYAGGLHVWPQTVAGTFLSCYQMMPRPACHAVRAGSEPDAAVLDMYDIATWKRMKWGLLGEEQDGVLQILMPEEPDRAHRLRAASLYLEKCLRRAARFSQAMDNISGLPEGLTIDVFAGDAVPTGSIAAPDGSGGLKIIAFEKGDGKVSAASASGGARGTSWSSVTHIPCGHMGMFRSELFRRKLLQRFLREQ